MVKESQAKVLLWITPRSCSTALERSISQIDSCHVFLEPFARVTWEDTHPKTQNIRDPNNDHKLNNGFHENDALFENTAEDKQNKIIKNEDMKTTKKYNIEKKNSSDAINEAFDTLSRDYPLSQYLFSKDTTRGVLNHKNRFLEERFRGFKHMFLVRHPYPTVLSYYKCFKDKNMGWDNFESDTLSYRHLCEMLQFVKEYIDPQPAVFRTEDLQVDPKKFMQRFCSEVGFPYSDSILSWPPNADVCNQFIPKWFEFHRKAAESCSFRILDKQAVMKFDTLDKHAPIVRDAISYNLEYYNLMKEDFIELVEF